MTEAEKERAMTNKTENMVERVARAVCEQQGGDFDLYNPLDIHRATYMEIARAAIKSMQEPTEWMALAAGLAHGPISDEDTSDHIREGKWIYQAAIRQAMEEG